MSITGLRLAIMVLKHRHIAFAAVFLSSVVAIAYAFIAPPVYTAAASFVPNAIVRTEFTSIAEWMRVIPQFQAELARSRDIMRRVLLTRYANPHTGDSLTFLDILGTKGDSLRALHDGLKRLEGFVSIRSNIQTAIVEISVDWRHPEVAAALANQFVYELNERNVGIRQERAREERDFFKEREKEAWNRLICAEDDLRVFYENNRPHPQSRLSSQKNILSSLFGENTPRYQSPRLATEEDRLMRNIEISEKIYREVKRAYEQALFMEASNIPTLLVIDPAVPPAVRSKPRRILIIASGLVMGVILSFVVVFSLQYIEHVRT